MKKIRPFLLILIPMFVCDMALGFDHLGPVIDQNYITAIRVEVKKPGVSIYKVDGMMAFLNQAADYIKPGDFHEKGDDSNVSREDFIAQVKTIKELVKAKHKELLQARPNSEHISSLAEFQDANIFLKRLQTHAIIGQMTDWAYRCHQQIPMLEGAWNLIVGDFRVFQPNFPDPIYLQGFVKAKREITLWLDDPVTQVNAVWHNLALETAGYSFAARKKARDETLENNPIKLGYYGVTEGDQKTFNDFSQALVFRKQQAQEFGKILEDMKGETNLTPTQEDLFAAYRKFIEHVEVRTKLMDAWILFNKAFADTTDVCVEHLFSVRCLLASEEVLSEQTNMSALNKLTDFRVSEVLYNWMIPFYLTLKSLILIQGHLIPQYVPKTNSVQMGSSIQINIEDSQSHLRQATEFMKQLTDMASRI